MSSNDDDARLSDGELHEPEEMGLEELREEYRERAGLGYSVPEMHDRKMALWHELRDRVDVEQPPCPECGKGNWGQAPGEPVQCNTCGEYLGENPELRQEIQNAWNKIMHGSNDDEKELVTDGGLVAADGNTPAEFEPAEEYDDYVALLANGIKKTHVVDPTTFHQGSPPADYDGYFANVGYVDSLCGGDTKVGRMVPLDGERTRLKSGICGHCLNQLEKLEADDE